MTYTDISSINMSKGGDELLCYVAQNVPIFFPMFLVAMFCIILGSSYFAQRKLTGRGNFEGSFAVAGYLTTIMSFILTLNAGSCNSLIDVFTLGIFIIISIIGTFWFLSSRDNYE